MKTPSKVSPRVAEAMIHDWFALNTGCVDGESLCKHCSQKIHVVMVCFSIHHAEFPECTGGGRVKIMPIPYCPKCEGVPERSACLHVPQHLEFIMSDKPQ